MGWYVYVSSIVTDVRSQSTPVTDMTSSIRFTRFGCSFRTNRYITRWGGAVVYPALDHTTTPASLTGRYVVSACGYCFDHLTHATVAEAKNRARAILTVLGEAKTQADFDRVAIACGGRHR